MDDQQTTPCVIVHPCIHQLLFILSFMQGNNADNSKTTAKRKIENPSQLEAIGNTEDINK